MPSAPTTVSHDPEMHPSYSWRDTLHDKPDAPVDAEAFRAAMANPRYPRSARWCPEWTFYNHMGPISLWCAEALADRIELRPGIKVLDLGCGAAATSIFLAREFGVEVWAVDLWIDAARNARRIAEAGLAAQVHPVHAAAQNLPFASGEFDAIVSIDAYHYFGTEMRYLSYLSRFVAPGGQIGIVVPGNAIDPDDPDALSPPPNLAQDLGADWYTFRSPEWWRRHWSRTPCIDVEHAAMISKSDEDWRKWIAADVAAHGEHARSEFDRRLLDSAAGKTMGLCLITARRNALPAPDMGIGDYEGRLA